MQSNGKKALDKQAKKALKRSIKRVKRPSCVGEDAVGQLEGCNFEEMADFGTVNENEESSVGTGNSAEIYEAEQSDDSGPLCGAEEDQRPSDVDTRTFNHST